jgi:5-methylcytosine-specific restriction enzyme subunit McrC
MRMRTQATPAMTLSVGEHESVAIGLAATSDELSYAEADVLDSHSIRFPGICQRGFRTVRFSQYAGLLGTGSRLIEVLPKVEAAATAQEGRRILMRLLRLSEETRGLTAGSLGQGLWNAPLLDLFIATYLDEVSILVRAGLGRRYVTHDEDLRALRGRLECGRQFRALADRRDLLACSFDELTPDNPWNRVLKAALRQARWWIRSPVLYRRWSELFGLFDEVVELQINPHDIDRLQFDRHSARYRPAIRWARRILDLLSPSLRGGFEDAPAFVFDMNQLFERAMAVVVRRAIAGIRSIRLSSQDRSTWLARSSLRAGRPEFALRPDLVLRREDDAILIIDTKWKCVEVDHTGSPVPDAADVYQMHAYASAFACKDVVLLYPLHSGISSNGSAQRFDLPASGGERRTLHVSCVDVDAPEPKLEPGLLELIQQAGS